MFREPRKRSEKHLDFIRSLPCVVCRNNIQTEAAHIRMADQRVAKRDTGKGEKPDDKWTVPLCGGHHRDQHSMNEFEFWLTVGIDPIFVAMALHAVTGDFSKGEQIISFAKESPYALPRSRGGLHV